ncbi:NAD(P)H:quinone oxidoreductase [Streptomyces sp. NBC_00249]|uniref:NAD(P)H:quinone oxidoreductase n=1 Tax=Streptomyces sp. NBC_00249 TaxID=2975690 RepID=UPI0022527392|nr:NAD(P)H:quinone oxidoreductase [Streptomyces sp. NBC_00249]MCX5195280.1 NAD(P)H:quinone oxidoreductase [Streptomyces sp. NBC_00249]
MNPKIAVIYYSATGTVHQLAQAVVEGAQKAGAEVRLLRAPELAPDEAVDSRPEWRAHVEATRDIPTVTHDDLRWADAYALGTPTRFGNVAAQLKQVIDGTGGLWAQGVFVDKPATAFGSAGNLHGGNESTLLALYNTLHHWGSLIVSPGFTDPVVYAANGNPYGTTHATSAGAPGENILEAARYQGARLAGVTARLLAGSRV